MAQGTYVKVVLILVSDKLQDSPTLTLVSGRQNFSQRQYLTVPFDLPSSHIVHTVRLQPVSPSIGNSLPMFSVAIDQPISMQLDISHTRQWDADLKQDSEPDTLDFQYEVHASPETWLIGGQRKAKFSSKVDTALLCSPRTPVAKSLTQEGENHAFSVLLVPQTTGRLLYPSVEIISLSKATHANQEGGEYPPLSSETDYLGQSETILVVPNLASTTVSLDPANGGWLVESRSR